MIKKKSLYQFLPHCISISLNFPPSFHIFLFYLFSSHFAISPRHEPRVSSRPSRTKKTETSKHPTQPASRVNRRKHFSLALFFPQLFLINFFFLHSRENDLFNVSRVLNVDVNKSLGIVFALQSPELNETCIFVY